MPLEALNAHMNALKQRLRLGTLKIAVKNAPLICVQEAKD